MVATVDEVENVPIPRRQMEQIHREPPMQEGAGDRPIPRQEMETEYELPPALKDTPLPEHDYSQDPNIGAKIRQLEEGKSKSSPMNFPQFALGLGEQALEMGTGFAGAVPAFFTGMGEAAYQAYKADPYDPQAIDKALNGYLEQFLETQGFFTYHPKSEGGKRISEAFQGAMEAYSKWGKENVSGPAGEAGFPGIEAWAQTGWESLPITLLMRKQGIKLGKGKGGELPGVAPPKPDVPRDTLPAKASPMEPKPVGERAIEDIQAKESVLEEVPAVEEIAKAEVTEAPARGEYTQPPRFDREQAKAEHIEQRGFEEGLRPEEVIETEKQEFGQEFDQQTPIRRQEMEQSYKTAPGDEPIVEHLDPLRTPEETPIIEIRPTKPFKAKGLDVNKDSMFDAIAKKGGLDRAEAENYLGLDPGQKLPTTVFGRPLFRKKGKSVDQMADDLATDGYLKRDPVTGKVDPREFEERFTEEAAGRKQYSDRRQFDDDLITSEYERYLREQFEEPPKQDATFRTGIPIEDIKSFTQKAWQNLKDKLGIKEPGVEVDPKPKPQGGAALSGLRSPGHMVKKIKGLEKPFKWALEAEDLSFRYKKIFTERRKVIRKILKKDGFFKYAENKKALHGLLIEGDFRGKQFSKAELGERGLSDNMIKAYDLTRSLYDRAWKMGKEHLEDFNQPIPEYMQGYVPHYFHDWFIRDADTGAILDSAKNLQQAVEAANKMKRTGKAENIDIYPKPKDFDGQEIQAAVIGDSRYLQMQKKLESRFKMTPEEAQKLLGGVFKKDSKGKVFENFLDRKGVSGWIKDLDYVENRYFNMLARYLSQDKFKKQAKNHFERVFGEFDKDWRGDARYVKNYINDVLGNPTAVEEMMNHFMKTAPGFKKITENYLGDRPSAEVASHITSAIGALKLGFYNLSAAGVNLTQLNNVYAILGEKAFVEGSWRATKAHKDIAAKNWNISKMKNPNSDLWVLKELGVDQQQGYAAVEGFTPGNFTKASLYAFTKAEFINRSVAALGGFHKFMRENKHLPLKERRARALKYAEDVNYRANFNYGVEDAQSYLRQSGPPGRVAFQFKKFVGKQFEFMTTLKGAENPRFWVPYLVIGGYLSIPGIKAISDMAEYFTGSNMEMETKNALMEWVEKDDDLERAHKQFIADNIMYGAFAHAGADASGRIGLGDALTGGNIGGPAVSTVVDTAKHLANEDYPEALRSFATAPGNLLIAAEDKVLRSPYRRHRKTVELEPWDRVLKGVGFRTKKEAIESDKTRYMGYKEKQIRQAEEDAITGYLDGVEELDKEKMDEYMSELMKLNVNWKRVQNEKIKRDKLTQSQRKLYGVPSKRRKDYTDSFRYGQDQETK